MRCTGSLCHAIKTIPCSHTSNKLKKFLFVQNRLFFSSESLPASVPQFFKTALSLRHVKSFWISLSLSSLYPHRYAHCHPSTFLQFPSLICVHARIHTHTCMYTNWGVGVLGRFFFFVYSIHSHLTTSGYHVISSDWDVNAKKCEEVFLRFKIDSRLPLIAYFSTPPFHNLHPDRHSCFRFCWCTRLVLHARIRQTLRITYWQCTRKYACVSCVWPCVVAPD